MNSRLDGLQAAVLSVKLTHLPGWTEARRRNAGRYSELLAGTPAVVPVESPDATSVYHLYVIRVAAELRDGLRAHLQERGISTGVHYPIALPNLLAYRYLNHSPQDFPCASAASREIVSLPMYAELTSSEIAYICQTVAAYLSAQPAAASQAHGIVQTV